MNPRGLASILLFLILLGLVGYFYNEINKLQEEIYGVEVAIRQVEQELRGFEGLVPDTLMITYLKEKIVFIDEWVFHNGKFFLNYDSSAITWGYMQNILSRFNQNFQFDFTVINRSGAFDYTVSGSGSIADLYAFLSHVEKLGALYTVENVVLNSSLQESETGPPNNVVSYNVLIRPWVDPAIGMRLNEQPFRRIQYAPLLRDPMRAAIHSPIRNPLQERLISYEDLRLISFGTREAFFTQEINSTVIRLRPMERVAYGYFSHVDEANSRAVFRINRTGLYETVFQPLR
ncbi:MAG: hypothetical protein FWG98_05295 [Candidatus Cloacimonetes bacterium]|nr:hypothetical protein [Candidatus Cloacimonadota bacterium]